MKRIPVIFVLVGVLLIWGCKPDPCEDTTCVHGTCEDGSCKCEEGWTGIVCAIEACDPECENGTCRSGFCDCDPGWEGESCNELARQKFLGTYLSTEICPPDSYETGMSVSAHPTLNDRILFGDLHQSSLYSDKVEAEVSGFDINIPDQTVGAAFRIRGFGSISTDGRYLVLSYDILDLSGTLQSRCSNNMERP